MVLKRTLALGTVIGARARTGITVDSLSTRATIATRSTCTTLVLWDYIQQKLATRLNLCNGIFGQIHLKNIRKIQERLPDFKSVPNVCAVSKFWNPFYIMGNSLSAVSYF